MPAINKKPSEAAGYFFAYVCPSPVATHKNVIFKDYTVEFQGENVTIRAPNRLRKRNWRPLPSLDSMSIQRLIPGLNFPKVPGGGIELFFNENDKLTLESCSIDDEESWGPDTFFIGVLNQPEEIKARKVAQNFFNNLISWIRVLTRQYWVGKSWDIHAEMLAAFPLTPDNRYGHKISVYSRSFFVSAQRSLPFTDEMLLEAIRRTIGITKPDPLEELIMDVDLFMSMGLKTPALLQASSIIEIARDRKLQITGKKIIDLKTSGTDLIKHLSVGFDRVYGRSLERDNQDLFEFLKELYIIRGHIAHATSLDSPVILDRVKIVTKNLTRNIRLILSWILEDRAPSFTPL